LFPLLATLAGVPAANAQEPLAYELRFERPNTHLMEITIRAKDLRGPAVEFAMPAWSPGWYVIRDFAKFVQEFEAMGPANEPLPWRKTDKQTWRVEIGSATSTTIRYKLYGNTLGVEWTQYNDRHAHVAGPATWMYLVGGKARPVQFAIEAPAGWRIATGMPRTGETTFTAPDFDTFLDSPIEVSDFAEKTFAFAGTTYHVIVHDVMGRKDFAQFTEDLNKAVQQLVPIFAPVAGGPHQAPFADYWFFFHVWPRTGGGLEHLNSTQIFLGSDWDAGYEGKLGVSAHEFFHAWNVKRLRPKALGPFDYSRENYTPSLWISEGVTSYYSLLGLVHAGLVKPDAYLDRMGGMISYFERQPGRHERSLEETSFDTWFWYRGPGDGDTNMANVDYSYYTGGQIMGHLLDFAIRHATDNQKSLDDWMRLLYQRHALPKPGFEPEDAVRAASEVAGQDMSEFFRRYVSGKEPWPYETYFAYAGIRVEKKLEPEKAWLGVSWRRTDAGQARITNIVPGSPAENGGLDKDDIVIAVEGILVNQDEASEAIASRKPGDEIRITVNHLGELADRIVRLGSSPYATYVLTPVENATEQQKKIYESWIREK